MTRSFVTQSLTALAAAILIYLPATAAACSACMGDPNSKSAGAINDAIFVLLACIGLVLGSLASFAVYLIRRAP